MESLKSLRVYVKIKDIKNINANKTFYADIDSLKKH